MSAIYTLQPSLAGNEKKNIYMQFVQYPFIHATTTCIKYNQECILYEYREQENQIIYYINARKTTRYIADSDDITVVTY